MKEDLLTEWALKNSSTIYRIRFAISISISLIGLAVYSNVLLDWGGLNFDQKSLTIACFFSIVASISLLYSHIPSHRLIIERMKSKEYNQMCKNTTLETRRRYILIHTMNNALPAFPIGISLAYNYPRKDEIWSISGEKTFLLLSVIRWASEFFCSLMLSYFLDRNCECDNRGDHTGEGRPASRRHSYDKKEYVDVEYTSVPITPLTTIQMMAEIENLKEENRILKEKYECMKSFAHRKDYQNYAPVVSNFP